MYTQCPFCQTVFGVAPEHLAAADGQVRCGYCQQLFNAEENLLIDLPEQEQEAEIAETTPLQNDTAPAASSEQDRLEEEEGAEPQQPTIYRQTALSPPGNDDQDTLNAIFADLDTRLVRMAEETADLQDEDEKKSRHRIDPTIDLSWEDMESGDYYPAPPRKDRGPQEPYIDPDDLDTLDRLAFDELEDTGSEPGEPRNHKKTVGNWDEVDSNTAIEFTRDMAAKQDKDKKPARGRLLDEEELGRLSAGDRVASESSPAEEQQQQSGNIEPPMDFEAEEKELPFHLRDAFTAQEAAPRSRWRILLLSLLFILAVDGIIFQLALFRNVELANRFPQLKPYLSEFCHYFPCTFSGPREVGRIYITDREVRSHPQVENALLVSAIFINRAGISQPYPDIVLTLSDLTNTVVAERRFTPADYLSQGQDRFQLMEADVPIHIQFEVLDPGNDAVNFEFTFK